MKDMGKDRDDGKEDTISKDNREPHTPISNMILVENENENKDGNEKWPWYGSSRVDSERRKSKMQDQWKMH